MIDIILNEDNNIVVVHDEPGFDKAKSVRFIESKLQVKIDNRYMNVGNVVDDVISASRKQSKVKFIRMSDWRIAKTADVPIDRELFL